MACSQQMQLEMSLNGTLVRNAVKSCTGSKRYVNIMVKAGIFNVMYRRLPINRAELQDKVYKGISFVVYKNRKVSRGYESEDQFINTFLGSIRGIKDALYKNYLKEVFLILRNRDGNILESYNFQLRYNPDSNFSYKNADGTDPDEIVTSTSTIFQAIGEMGKSKKLDASTLMHIELAYTADCPSTYEPPGFEAASSPNCLKIKNRSVLGTVDTRFHKLIMKTSNSLQVLYQSAALEQKTAYSQSTDELEPPATEDEEPIILIEDGADANTAENNPDTHQTEQNDMEIEMEDLEVRMNRRKKFNTSNITISEKMDVSLESELFDEPISSKINCLCLIKYPLKVPNVVCSKCNKVLHAPCCGLEDSHSTIYSCVDCGTSDKIIAETVETLRSSIAKLRLVVYFLLKTRQTPEYLINVISKKEKQHILSRLKYFGVLKSHVDDFNNDFDTANLEKARHVLLGLPDSQYL